MGLPTYDRATVDRFGLEWSRFDQSGVSGADLQDVFEQYFSVFPWDRLGPSAVGIDVGCGSGRWAKLVAPQVGSLLCVEPSAEAAVVAARNLEALPKCTVILGAAGALPVRSGSLDFGYALGVLHHTP